MVAVVAILHVMNPETKKQMVKKCYVKCMTYIFRGKNPFRFPAKDDILNYEIEDIIAVNRPTRSQQYFETNETQFAGLQQKQ